jgi:hypothetical protein
MPKPRSSAARQHEAALIARHLQTKGVTRCPTRSPAGGGSGNILARGRPLPRSAKTSVPGEDLTIDDPRYQNNGLLYPAVNSGPYRK